MTGRFSLFVMLALLCLPVAGQAEVRTGAVTLTPMLGYQAFDSDLDLDNAAAYGVAIGYTASKNWALELDFRYTPSEA